MINKIYSHRGFGNGGSGGGGGGIITCHTQSSFSQIALHHHRTAQPGGGDVRVV